MKFVFHYQQFLTQAILVQVLTIPILPVMLKNTWQVLWRQMMLFVGDLHIKVTIIPNKVALLKLTQPYIKTHTTFDNIQHGLSSLQIILSLSYTPSKSFNRKCFAKTFLNHYQVHTFMPRSITCITKKHSKTLVCSILC